MRDPFDYCPVCDRRFGLEEESCSGCGFDPVNSEEDSIAYDKAIAAYVAYKGERKP